jgi:hypothetical protein
MRNAIWTVALLMGTWIASPVVLADVVLDFEGLGLLGYSEIPQTYGDTIDFDVSYRELDGFGNGTTVRNSLSFWESGYGDLSNVIWGFNNVPSQVAEIRIATKTGNAVQLKSFDSAEWNFSTALQNFRIYDGSLNLLFERSNFDVTDTTRDSFNPNVSAGTLILQWDNPFSVALDNIRISAVPEPSSVALTFIVTGSVIARRRFQRKR